MLQKDHIQHRQQTNQITTRYHPHKFHQKSFKILQEICRTILLIWLRYIAIAPKGLSKPSFKQSAIKAFYDFG